MEETKITDPAIAPNGLTANPENPENENNINTLNPDGTSLALDSLTDDERDLYESSKDFGEVELSTLPPSLREEITAIREKLSAAPTPEDTAAPADETPDSAPESPAEDDATAPEDTAAPADTPAEADDRIMSDAEKISRLEALLRKKDAAYATLQGKYNKEIKLVRENQSAANGDPATGDGTAAEAEPSRSAKYSEKFGLDEDVAKALTEISDDIAQPLKHRISAQESELLSLKMDALLFEKCGVRKSEVENQPLFDSIASDMIDKNDVDALTAIANAKANGDLSEMADIISEVVGVMKERGAWKGSRGYSAVRNAEPAAASNAPAPVQAERSAAAPKAEVSAVTPHSASGVVNTAPHTARTIEQVEAEYDALEKRRRKGDFSVIPQMDKLSKEYSRLMRPQ